MADDSETADTDEGNELTIETFLKLIAGSVEENISTLPDGDSVREAINDAHTMTRNALNRLLFWLKPVVEKMRTEEEKRAFEFNLLGLMVGMNSLGNYIGVPPEAKRQMERERAMQASSMRSTKTKADRERLEEAILKVQSSVNLLAASEHYAAEIRPDVCRALGITESESWPSVSLIKKTIFDIKHRRRHRS
jgi:hypothetical protein